VTGVTDRISLFDKEITLYQRDELTRYRSYEVYTQSTGVEIREAVKSHEENGRVLERAGQIQLRFFKLTSKTRSDEVTQIRFICEPDESLALAPMIGQVAGSSVPCREKLNPHKFTGGEQGGEAVTTVSVEKWKRGGKGGFALTIMRGKEFISVAMPLTKFLFAGEFLRLFATEQCWAERVFRRGHQA